MREKGEGWLSEITYQTSSFKSHYLTRGLGLNKYAVRDYNVLNDTVYSQ